jgi:hypothetical protein
LYRGLDRLFRGLYVVPMLNHTTQQRLYDPAMIGKFATTNHGERVTVIGAAMDPARAKVQPADHKGRPIHDTEWFTPQVANLVFA